MPTEQQVLDALIVLGRNEGEVAQTLTRLGIKGSCGDASRCAVAEYLTQRFPELHWSVSQIKVYGMTDPEATRGVVGISPPNAVSRFVTSYDLGHYPDLAR